jgi:cell division septation protein DedD
LKTRLLGAAVLIALAVLFVPMFFSGNPPAAGGDQAVSLAIPPAPDRDLQTRTMSLNPADAVPAAAATRGASAIADRAAGASTDQLATVDIGSRRPRDVETDPAAGTTPAPTTVTAPTAKSVPAPTGPLIKPQAASTPAQVPAPAADTAGTAARGVYSLNLSAYSNAANARQLEQRVRALGYPVAARAVQQSGKALTMVSAGPFSTRTAAEAARLKITQTIPGATAHLESGASDQHGDVPATAAAATPAAHASLPTTRAGGFAVQVAAVASQADANALRDKLRGAGFDGFVDSVNVGGKQLWRVRAGPLAQRDTAISVRDQIKARLGLAGNVVSVP